MPNYLIRFDRGGDERFDAASDAAARDYVRELLADLGADEGDGGSLYLVNEGGRGDEEFISEVRLGDDDGDGDDEATVPCYWRQGWPID